METVGFLKNKTKIILILATPFVFTAFFLMKGVCWGQPLSSEAIEDYKKQILALQQFTEQRMLVSKRAYEIGMALCNNDPDQWFEIELEGYRVAFNPFDETPQVNFFWRKSLYQIVLPHSIDFYRALRDCEKQGNPGRTQQVIDNLELKDKQANIVSYVVPGFMLLKGFSLLKKWRWVYRSVGIGMGTLTVSALGIVGYQMMSVQADQDFEETFEETEEIIDQTSDPEIKFHKQIISICRVSRKAKNLHFLNKQQRQYLSSSAHLFYPQILKTFQFLNKTKTDQIKQIEDKLRFKENLSKDQRNTYLMFVYNGCLMETYHLSKEEGLIEEESLDFWFFGSEF